MAPAVVSVSSAAARTELISLETVVVTVLTPEMFRLISAVAVDCCWTPAAISANDWSTVPMIPVMPLMARVAPEASVWIALILSAMSAVARAVWLARLLTSDATTAKPLPASPARAASIVAFVAF
jgi:hypothetical protein